MFEFESLAHLKALSVTDRGSEVYFPRIIPRELGGVLEELNTDNLFHIVHYPSHSEIWHKNHWNDSISKRWKLLEDLQVKSDERNARAIELRLKRWKVQTAEQVILKWCPFYGHQSMATQLSSLAYTLANASPETAKQIPGLHEALYGEENRKENT